jgi:aryl-alcohol dehydrogenase-like predicted oxidoreductase
MEYAYLGRSNVKVSKVCLGTMHFGRRCDEKESFAIMDRALEMGINFWDTANVYGEPSGHSEEIIGRWFAQGNHRRDEVVLATKVYGGMGKPGPNEERGISDYKIRMHVAESLRRLQTDRIDLYQSHDDDANVPLEETLAAFGELIAEGKVRAIGASNYSAPRLAEALAVSERLGLPRYETLQPLYNLVDRAAYEADLQALCLQHGLGVINFFGLARGFLTGKYRSEADLAKSPRGAGVKAACFNERGWRVLAALDTVAERTGATPAQVALAWQMAQPGITAPIASATSVQQWAELAPAATLQLDAEALKSLTEASAGN